MLLAELANKLHSALLDGLFKLFTMVETFEKYSLTVSQSDQGMQYKAKSGEKAESNDLSDSLSFSRIWHAGKLYINAIRVRE